MNAVTLNVQLRRRAKHRTSVNDRPGLRSVPGRNSPCCSPQTSSHASAHDLLFAFSTGPLIQPIAADAVASVVARTAVGEPINGTIEIAGPEQFGLDELIRKGLSFRGDPREVVADPEARYFGALLEERTLLPDADALTLDPRFEDWLVQTAPQT